MAECLAGPGGSCESSFRSRPCAWYVALHVWVASFGSRNCVCVSDGAGHRGNVLRPGLVCPLEWRCPIPRCVPRRPVLLGRECSHFLCQWGRLADGRRTVNERHPSVRIPVPRLANGTGPEYSTGPRMRSGAAGGSLRHSARRCRVSWGCRFGRARNPRALFGHECRSAVSNYNWSVFCVELLELTLR